MNFRTLSVLCAFSLTAVAQGANAAPYVKGTPAYKFSQTGERVTLAGEPLDMKAIGGKLATQLRWIATADRAVETSGQVLELYAGTRLMMAIDLNTATPSIAYARRAFGPAEIFYSRQIAEQSPASALLEMKLQHCVDAVHDQSKGEGKGEQDQAQNQDQNQDQPNEERVKGEPPVAKAQDCKEVVVTKAFEQEHVVNDQGDN